MVLQPCSQLHFQWIPHNIQHRLFMTLLNFVRLITFIKATSIIDTYCSKPLWFFLLT